jgi:mannose-6-phosphate isomerase-like protein (cupin superfamily)
MAGIVVRRAPAPLGVTATCARLVELPPGEHEDGGRDEVYVVLRGAGRLVCGGLDVELVPGVVVRVGPEPWRIAAAHGDLHLLALRD